MLPRQPEALREQLAMGVAQVKMLRELQDTARQHGHTLGVYCTAAKDDEGNGQVHLYPLQADGGG